MQNVNFPFHNQTRTRRVMSPVEIRNRSPHVALRIIHLSSRYRFTTRGESSSDNDLPIENTASEHRTRHKHRRSLRPTPLHKVVAPDLVGRERAVVVAGQRINGVAASAQDEELSGGGDGSEVSEVADSRREERESEPAVAAWAVDLPGVLGIEGADAEEGFG